MYVEPVDEARGVGADRTFIVEWYRVEQRRTLLGIWVAGASLLSCGVLMLAVVYRGTDGLGWPLGAGLAIVGALLTLAGPLFAVLAFQKVLSDDSYVALRGDGVLYNDGQQDHLIRWDDLEEVVHDAPTGAVRLRTSDGRWVSVEIELAGIAPQDLATRIVDVRRKALLELLRPQH